MPSDASEGDAVASKNQTCTGKAALFRSGISSYIRYHQTLPPSLGGGPSPLPSWTCPHRLLRGVAASSNQVDNQD